MRRATGRPGWSNPATRAIVYQVLALAAVALGAGFLVVNTLGNLADRHIASGFGFLSSEAGFAIGESVVRYGPQDTYARAIFAGIVNTLRVTVAGIVLATVVGTVIGIARLSRNWLVARAAAGYVELVRNIPLLLQLFLWYALLTENMPGPREAAHPLPGIFVSNRGIKLPVLADGTAANAIVLALGLGIVLALMLGHYARRRTQSTGRALPTGWLAALAVIGLPVAAWLLCGAPTALDLPTMRTFDFVGGATLSPEYCALLLGLVVYTAAFIAEIVRAGIQAVDKGQWEAAGSLGLRRAAILRLIVLPQAMRVIVPPLTSQYLNVTKNSSLALAIGYPDLVSVANTTLNQTGQAIEGVLIIMGAYLVVSLSISVLMNWYNRRIALTER